MDTSKYKNLIDDTIDKIETGELIFGDEKTSNRIKHDSYERTEKAFKKQGICVYKDCTNKSIKRSHTIPMSKALKIISEHNHLYHIDLNIKNEKFPIKMTKIGLKEATVFPGFCKKHELLFADFENKGEFENINQIYKQVYRSVCRDIAFHKNELENINIDYDNYIKIREEKSKEYINNILTHNNVINSKLVDNIQINMEDYQTSYLSAQKKNEKRILTRLFKFKQILERAVEEEGEIYGLCSKNIIIEDGYLPVALSGFSTLRIRDKQNKDRMIYCLINIIPISEKTLISLIYEEEDYDIMNPFVEKSFQNNISILNMVESFMLHGSDGWYIKPSIWEDIPDKRKESILKDFLLSNKSFIDDSNFLYLMSLGDGVLIN